MKKKIIVGMVSLFVLFIIICCYRIWKVYNQAVMISRYDSSVIGEWRISQEGAIVSSISYIDQKKWRVVKQGPLPPKKIFIEGAWKHIYYSLDYSINTSGFNYSVNESKKVYVASKDSMISKVAYYDLTLYDIRDNKVNELKKLDFKKIINNYDPNLEPIYIRYFIGNSDYLSITVLNTKGNDYKFDLYLNVVEEKLYPKEDLPSAISTFMSSNPNEMEQYFFTATNFKDLLGSKNLMTSYTDEGTLLFLSIFTDFGEDVNYKSLLFEEYPVIESNLKNKAKGMEIHFGSSPPTMEELLRLLMPVDKNPFEGLKLKEDYSKDGQVHEIHSMEGYYQWYSRPKRN